MAVTFILLPLYGNLVDGDIYSVNLLSFTDTTPNISCNLLIVFIVLIALGIAKLMCVCFEKESWSNIITKCSHRAEYAFICFFAAARQPYVTALMFLLFVATNICLDKANPNKVKCHKPFKIGSDTISVGAFFVLTSIVSAL